MFTSYTCSIMISLTFNLICIYDCMIGYYYNIGGGGEMEMLGNTPLFHSQMLLALFFDNVQVERVIM